MFRDDDDNNQSSRASVDSQEFIRCDILWEFFEAVEKRLEITMDQKESKTSELIKLLTSGRREMLEGFMEFVELNSVSFPDLCSQLGYDIRYQEDS